MDHAQLALQHIQKRTLVAEHVPLVSLTVWLDLCYAADKATDKPTYKKMFSQVMAINEAQGKINDALAKLEPVKSMELDSKDLKALWQVFVVRPQRDRVVWETIESLVDTRDDLCDEFLETMAAFIQQPTELWTLPKTIEIPLPETSDLLADPTKLEPWIAKAKLDTWEDAIELQVVAATKLYEALGKQQQASFPGHIHTIDGGRVLTFYRTDSQDGSRSNKYKRDQTGCGAEGTNGPLFRCVGVCVWRNRADKEAQRSDEESTRCVASIST